MPILLLIFYIILAVGIVLAFVPLTIFLTQAIFGFFILFLFLKLVALFYKTF